MRKLRIIYFADLIDQLLTSDVEIISRVLIKQCMQRFIEFGWKNNSNIKFQAVINDTFRWEKCRLFNLDISSISKSHPMIISCYEYKWINACKYSSNLDEKIFGIQNFKRVITDNFRWEKLWFCNFFVIYPSSDSGSNLNLFFEYR